MADSPPPKKKLRIATVAAVKSQKRMAKEFTSATPVTKPRTSESASETIGEDLSAKRRRNFVTVCEIVSRENFFDFRCRFNLTKLSKCMQKEQCVHHELKNQKTIMAIPDYAKEGFKIDFKTHMWCDALDDCRMTLSHTCYLPSDILQNIVEIILNAHDDRQTGFTIPYLLDRCQQTLSLAFNTHPPCSITEIRRTYTNFLTSQLVQQKVTFSKAAEYEPHKGLFKYCFNRLEYELSRDSLGEPLVNVEENIPEEMKETVKGLHWQKDKFEIFDTLNRQERINRLMVALESILELLKLDSAIWHSRHSLNQGRNIMRSNKPLMAYVLWSDNILYTGAVNNISRQIIKIFIQMIHLDYPEKFIRVMTEYFNLMVQTFYICENDCEKDYPNTGKFCIKLAIEMKTMLKDFPPTSTTKILKRINPHYMRYMIGVQLMKEITDIKESDALKLILQSLQSKVWNEFKDVAEETRKKQLDVKKPRHLRKLYNFLAKVPQLKKQLPLFKSISMIYYPKFDKSKLEYQAYSKQNVINILLIMLESFLNAHSVENFEFLIDNYEENKVEHPSYHVSAEFVKRYRTIVETLREISVTLLNFKKDQSEYKHLKLFERISIFQLGD